MSKKLKRKRKKKKNENDHLKNVSIPKGIDVDSVDIEAKYLLSSKSFRPTSRKRKRNYIKPGRSGPYLKCENKSARLDNVEDLFSLEQQ